MLFIPPRQSSAEPRRAVVLLVVIALLTLFAVVGVSFVYYADAEATSALYFRQAKGQSGPDVDPEMAMAFFLGQLICGVDDTSGLQSALRGHDLARLMYGTFNSTGTNNIPFNGTGRLHLTRTYRNLTTNTPLFTRDDYDLINYTYFPADGFVRDPERFTVRANPTAAQGVLVGGFNAPYTYPDLNNMFLAAVRADGTVLVPSFHRPWLFGSLLQTNTNWTSPEGKYLTLRPRPREHTSQFPFPDDATGDVRNLPFGPGAFGPGSNTTLSGNNDSIWLDLGAPILTAPDGRKYKMLFAPLIIDLDGRINLNVAGNIKGAGGTSASSQGWGPWEINPAKVLPVVTESTRLLFNGQTAPNPPVTGRYGKNLVPPFNPPNVPHGTALNAITVPWYSQLNFNLSNIASMTMPAGTSCFPTYTGYSDRYATLPAPGTLANHPALYNVLQPQGAGLGRDQTFALSNMEALLRYGDSGSPALTSDLFRLFPLNFANSRVRNLVTLRSMDLAERPGLSPLVWDPKDATTAYLLNAVGTNYSTWFPTGQPIGTPFNQPNNPIPAGAVPTGSDYNSTDYRASLAALLRVDLNRTLRDYPAQQNNGRINQTPVNIVAFTNAQLDRQLLAKDIFETLLKVTGAQDPRPNNSTLQPTSAEFRAARWLAQLAVNIVDYIDPDDYITPWNWINRTGPNAVSEWVFGTEVPRLVLNEAYVQFDNENTDPGLTGATPRATYYKVNTWVELHNPFYTNAPSNNAYPRDNGVARLQMPRAGAGPNAQAQYAVHQILICKASAAANMRDPGNVTGDPTYNPAGGAAITANVLSTMNVWGGAAANVVVQPSSGAYSGPTRSNQGFSVVGPTTTFLPGRDPNIDTPTQISTIRNARMSARTTDEPTGSTMIVLQRLACPHLPPNPGVATPTLPYNPYVTVDYLSAVTTYDARQYRINAVNGSFTTGNTWPPAAGTVWASYGRTQPYAADTSQLKPQNNANPTAGQPKNTFFRHNAVEAAAPASAQTAGQTLKVPFDWLVHLDRPLISPMELLHVSGYKPHELTQQFVQGATGFGTAFNHYAPWVVDNARIWRLFEYLTTRTLPGNNTAGGVMPGARVAGKVNINTIWDDEVWQALCDSTGTSTMFTATGVGFANTVLGTRTPNNVPGRTDRPFLSFGGAGLAASLTAVNTTSAAGVPAAGVRTITPASMNNIQKGTLLLIDSANNPEIVVVQTVTANNFTATFSQVHGANFTINGGGSGVNNTILRLQNGGNLVLDLTTATLTHPYQKHSVLTKIFNNLTTRSNVFAVWVTVGFFDVTDGPVTTLTRFTPPGTRTVAVGATSGVINGVPWDIHVGSPVTFLNENAGPTAGQTETVTVTAVNTPGNPPPPNITARFSQAHNAGEYIMLKGALGAEVGRAEGRQVRHRMFALVDRTNLNTGMTAAPFFVMASGTGTGPGGVGTITVPATSGTYDGASYAITRGMKLAIDFGANQEVVTVSTTIPPSPTLIVLQGPFTKTHTAPFLVSNAILGNPGPQPNFNPRANPGVVPYMSVIE